MTLLQVDHVTFGYGADLLFDDVSFSIAAGERVALVAPNGQGKSTLLKIVAGELAPDEGRVLIPKGTRVGYLHQSHEPDARGTVLDVLLAPFVEAREARAALAAAEHAAASGSDADLDRLARAQDRHHAVGADAIEREVSVIAHKVGFRDRDLERTVASLSGGERGRLQLAAVLASRPDLLLLDEPTNHLDLETVVWLEGFLRSSFRGAAIIVSHDRAFLDATCPKTAELGLLAFRFYHAKYSDYVVAREADLERERAAVFAQKALISKTEDFIRRNIAGQKTNQAKARRKMLDKLERLDNPEDIWADARKLGLRFSPARRTGDIVMECTGLRAERGGRVLFEGVDLLLRRLDRLAIVGPNGAGKSTLLRILASGGSGAAPPTGGGKPPAPRAAGDSGEVRLGTNLDLGYFDQHLESLDPGKSCVETIRAVRPEMVVDVARQYLARFRFWGDDPFRAVGSLSGGERTRLALAKLLLVPRNVLLLDEPTNHLDIPACEILEEALAHYEGTVVLVSHDRYFLARVTTRVLHLESGRATLHSGGYGDWAARQAAAAARASARPAAGGGGGAGGGARSGFQSEGRARATSAAPGGGASGRSPARSPEAPGGDKAQRKQAYEAAKKNSRESDKRTRRVAELEKLMSHGETTLKSLRAELASAPGGQWERLAELAEKEQELVRKLDGWTEEWMRLSEEATR